MIPESSKVVGYMGDATSVRLRSLFGIDQEVGTFGLSLYGGRSCVRRIILVHGATSFIRTDLAAEKPDRQIGVLHGAYICQWSKGPHLFEIALQGFIN